MDILLLETGDALLLETGGTDNLILEDGTGPPAPDSSIAVLVAHFRRRRL